jgi:metal-dependent amidase/aminoacylase/carboxypeptidase family protein
MITETSMLNRPEPNLEVLHGDLWRRLVASIEARTDPLVKLRRRIHATPEPSNQELSTTSLVAEVLRDYGLEPRVMEHEVGVIVDLNLGADTESYIALRSELDCVQVNDDKQVPYASTRPGLCHACGHDMHTAIVLGSVISLAENIEQLRAVGFHHNLRAVFQPAEEAATGARQMINQGAIDGVEAILAVHVDPMMETGVIGVRRGALTSACKDFLVLTVASITSGSATNAIPDEATIRGTLRTTRVEDTEVVQRRMHSIVRGVAESTGCECHLEFPHHAPPTDNDPILIDLMAGVVRDILGPDHIRWIELPSLGAEDFGFYQELIRGAIVRLGVAGRDGRTRHPLHSSLFDVDESALPIGVKFLTRCALDLALGPLHPPA